MKTFTENFNTGWGIGQLRGKGDDSYGLSNVSGSSGRSTKDEKHKTRPATNRAEGKQNDNAPPARRNADYGTEPVGLKLRPETDLKNFTNISSEPVEPPLWRGGSSLGSDDSADGDMVIVRETAFEVQNDRAPMLPVAARFA